MEAIVNNFRQGRHTHSPRHCILTMEGVDNKEKAAKLIGKEVSWTSSSGKILSGKIASTHGNSGAVRAVFEHGLPGQAIGKKIEVKA
ncbi:MAG: 50S ribosomal protein L35ae [archaeon]